MREVKQYSEYLPDFGAAMAIKEEVIIGDCKLIFGDSMDVMPLIKGVDAVLTDPPYGLGKKIQCGKRKRYNNWYNLTKNVGWDVVPSDNLFNSILALNVPSIIWGGNYFSLPPSRNFIVWDKGGMSKGRSFAECEMAWCSWDGNAKIKMINPPVASGAEPQKVHPTQKPIQLMDWCLSLLPKETKCVFDPFMGSGTTGVSCVKMRIGFIGIEKEKEYFDVACKRIENAYRQGVLF